jgi:mannose-6-phosphate isomerase-like protein (cupin superfamily)
MKAPWGEYIVLYSGVCSKLTLLVINPLSNIELHKHKHKEHYIIIHGGVSIRIDKIVHNLSAGSSFDIPPGVKHCLCNPFDSYLFVVESQFSKEG